MTRAMRTTSKIVLLVTSLVGAAASAQIVTPPPAEARPVDAFVPKPAVRPAAPAQLTPQQMQAANPPPVRAKVQPPTLPDLKWDSLVKRDGEGKLIPLAEPLDLAQVKDGRGEKCDQHATPRASAERQHCFHMLQNC